MVHLFSLSYLLHIFSSFFNVFAKRQKQTHLALFISWFWYYTYDEFVCCFVLGLNFILLQLVLLQVQQGVNFDHVRVRMIVVLFCVVFWVSNIVVYKSTWWWNVCMCICMYLLYVDVGEMYMCMCIYMCSYIPCYVCYQWTCWLCLW